MKLFYYGFILMYYVTRRIKMIEPVNGIHSNPTNTDMNFSKKIIREGIARHDYPRYSKKVDKVLYSLMVVFGCIAFYLWNF